ncbi:Maleate isomerase [subsurface metagenome]
MLNRRRVGLMVPATNATFEADFALVVPKEITLHSHRLWMSGGVEGEDFVDKVNEEVEEAAKYLAMAKVEVIAYGFTTGSFYRGIAYSKQLEERIQKAAGVPGVTPATAIVEALHYFEAKKLSVATPYPEWNNAMLLRYLDEAGFDVLNLEGDPRPASIAIREPMWDQEPESIVDFASKVCLPEADVLLCPCTAWRALEVVEELEQRLGIPVVTANQTAIWATFRKLGIFHSIHGFGRLLESLSSAKM